MKNSYTVFIILLFAGIYNSAKAQSLDINGPVGSLEFGKTVKVLSNGNYVVIDPSFSDGAIPYVGAVYLYNGTTHTLISTLKGSASADVIGSGGLTVLDNGNFLVNSPKWDKGSLADAGAVTLVNGVTGLSGVVSSSNSLVGSSAQDQVGFGMGMSNPVILLGNGNYLIHTPNWDKGSIENVGAVTWANGNTGITGEITNTNSLTGSKLNDQIGGTGINVLTNGNYVVRSYSWMNNLNVSVGAATWGNGNTGIVGEVNSSNSLVGSSPADQIGRDITILSNGNYVLSSALWNNGSIVDAGSVTWCDGNTGRTGEVNDLNSLVGIKANDGVTGTYALTNGHYVVIAPYWDNGTKQNVGAVTWCNGTTGRTGVITTANSLVGTTAGDLVGYGIEGIVALTNGNYVVASLNWRNGFGVKVGAVTWVNGSDSVMGIVSSSNSLVGSKAGDDVGLGGVTPLSNGNYVVDSYNWGDGINTKLGAITWGNGNTGISGEVGSSNSLIGGKTNDRIGSDFVTALPNGNYLVSSQNWQNGTLAAAGAITWGNGNSGTTGVVSSSNSLVGSSQYDRLGQTKTTILTNGNYVVNAVLWDNGTLVDAGAATWANGNTGIAGEINSSNSLVGIHQLEKLGSMGVTALANGNYVVNTHNWDAVSFQNVGAITWGDGSAGITGDINQSNSLFGKASNDAIGSGGITAFSNGSYAVLSPYWNNAALQDGGAVTLGNGSTSLTGFITNCNSVLGASANNGNYMSSAYNAVNNYMMVARPRENIVSIYNPTAITLAQSLDAVNVFINGNNQVPLITNNECRIMATILPNGSNAVSGILDAKVWIESAVPSYLGEPYVARHFEITPSMNTSTATAKLTLYFTQEEFADFNAHPGSTLNLPLNASDATGISNLRVRKFSGTSSDGSALPGTYSGSVEVIDPADNEIIWNDLQSRWEVSFEVTGFSGFIVETSSAVLPLSLLEFNGSLQNDNALLNWKTADEQNTKSFDVERSIDGRNYSSIGNVNSANTNGIHHYSFTDNKITSLGASVIYYRLKQIDNDGQFVYSKIIALSVEHKNLVLLYPNPAVDEINILINTNKKSQSQLKIIDNLGRVVKQQQLSLLNGSTTLSMNVEGLSKGIYYLEIKGGVMNERKRFVKQ